jgi:hypothetical protein
VNIAAVVFWGIGGGRGESLLAFRALPSNRGFVRGEHVGEEMKRFQQMVIVGTYLRRGKKLSRSVKDIKNSDFFPPALPCSGTRLASTPLCY